MNDDRLNRLRDLVQIDVGNRGLARDLADNLLTRTRGDFAAACRSIAGTEQARLAIVTGFTIPGTEPPLSETDGPPGTLFLARALVPLGIEVTIATDGSAFKALAAGLQACDLAADVPLVQLPADASDYPTQFRRVAGELTHLIAIERVGPNASGRCLSMRGSDITAHTSPAHLLFEAAQRSYVTIGIGDGGNEIGMGKLPTETIARNVPNGALVACRTPADHLIVAGTSNWGAYALAIGVSLLRTWMLDPALFDIERERCLLQIMVEAGPLVDGLTREPKATVDGLSLEQYAEVLSKIGRFAM